MPLSPLVWLAAITAFLWLATSLEAALGMRKVRLLRDLPLIDPHAAPRVTIVVAARNEEAKIQSALESLLRQEYGPYDVVVVNDRSTDGTAEILRGMAAREPRLRLMDVAELPEGWLGKNHALQRGADAAGGEWLLFTDADVVMEPTVLARAMGYAIGERLDHLTIAPKLVMPSAALDAFGGAFAVFFARFARPWKARDPRSRRHVGIGAFNLVRASTYWAAGGHEPLAMRPDDDLKLGKVLKTSGARQDLVIGGDMVSVEWYGSVREAVLGLEKNTFAGLEYSVPAVIAASLVSLTVDVWPFVGVLLTTGAARWLNALTAATAVVFYAGSTRASGTRAVYGFAYPLATLLLLFIVVRSTVLALRNGGIRWRGTLYPLDRLRENRV